MDIIKTDIIDSDTINVDNTSKILLMDNLIEYFSPLFYEDLRKKQRQVQNNKTDVKKLKLIIEQNKTILIKLQDDIKVENLKQEILKEIEYLGKIDVLYGRNKTTVQSIISAIDKLSLENLKKRSELLHKLVNTKRGWIWKQC